jgi:hypothetical protein
MTMRTAHMSLYFSKLRKMRLSLNNSRKLKQRPFVRPDKPAMSKLKLKSKQDQRRKHRLRLKLELNLSKMLWPKSRLKKKQKLKRRLLLMPSP